MSGVVRLAWRHLTFHRVRSAVLAAAIALTLLVPLTVAGLVEVYGRAIEQRAAATPLVLGARGSRFDLVLNALSFRGRVPDPLPMRAAREMAEGGLGAPIPLVVRSTARGHPVVGTTPDYYGFRGLSVRSGSLPVFLGECVLGAEVRRRLGLRVGDGIATDPEDVWSIDAAYPLRMRIVGVLRPSGTADDHAVFTSLETAWIAEGLGHGHDDVDAVDEDHVMSESEGAVRYDSGVLPYQEITEENADSFHFHGDRDDLPLTAAIVVPRDARSRTLLKGRYRVADGVQLLEPTAVVDEVTGFVLRLKTFFDANVLLVLAATGVFLGLVVLLSVRVRQREFETLARIGCARSTTVRMVAIEYATIVVVGVAAAAVIAAAAVFVVWSVLGLAV